MAENLSVSWVAYQKNICNGLGALQQQGEFVDMTLAADGHHVKAHQMVMSLVSPYIKDLIKSANCPHPRVSARTMRAIIEYAYSGEAVVPKDNMGDFLEACRELHITGLEDIAKGETPGDSSSILSNCKKRKRSLNEIDQLSDDDDYNQTDGTVEVKFENNTLAKTEDKNETVESKEYNETSKLPPAAVQYSVSIHGNLQVVLNRFLYSFIRFRKNNQRYWRCVNQQKTGCLAFVITQGDNVHERGHPHNHSFHDKQILKRMKNGNVFTSVTEVKTNIKAKKQKRGEADILGQALPSR